MTKSQPSKIARQMCVRVWGTPDDQRMIAKGVYWFSTPSHGGAIAVIGHAEIPNSAIDAARKNGLIDKVRPTYDNTPTECWIGEEDCGYATLILSDPSLRVAQAFAKYFHDNASKIYLDAWKTCISWHEQFVQDFDPNYTPQPHGQIRTREYREEVLSYGGLKLISCSTDSKSSEHVLAVFCSPDRSKSIYRVRSDIYDKVTKASVWDGGLVFLSDFPYESLDPIA